MKAFIEKEERVKQIKFTGTVKKLLLELKINPETVIVTRNDALLSDDDKIKDSDEIEILSVISGG